MRQEKEFTIRPPTDILPLASRSDDKRSRYEAFFNLTADGILFHELVNGAIFDANPVFCRLLGYSRDEILSLRLEDLMVPAAEQTPEEQAEMASRQTCRRESILAAKDGRHIHVEIISRLYEQHKRVMALSCVRDITIRKEEQRRLQQESREIALINRLLQVFVEESDEDLFDRVLAIVQEGLNSRHGVFGYIPRPGHLICPSLSKMLANCEIDGKCIHYPPEKWKGLWAAALREKRSIFTNQPPAVPPGHLPIRNNLAAPVLFRGDVIGLLNVANKTTDYTDDDRVLLEAMADRIAPLLYAWIQKKLRDEERTAAEESLKSERALLKGIIDHIPVLLCIWDPQFERFTFNRELTEVLGWTEADCQDGDFLSKVYPDPAYRQEVIDFMQSLDERWRDLKSIAKDGTEIDCSWANVQLPDGRYIGIGIDIRDRKQAEAALRKMNEVLEARVDERTVEAEQKAEQLRSLALQLTQAEQRERKRLSAILHDHIQQLLVAARLQLGWIKKGGDQELAIRTADEVSGILNEALTASRNLAVDLSPPVLHEAGLIAALKWLASDMQKKSQFTVHLKTDSRAEPHTEETRALLFECVRELLLNTMKHAEVASADVTLMRTDDRHIQLIVSDQGKGFEPDLLEKRRSDELSFGLFSCQERILQIGGQMDIETAPGQGACIVLTVPYLGDLKAGKTDTQQRLKGARPMRIREKKDVCEVLIVDDHKIVRDGISKLLQFESGIEVIGETADGPQALRLAHRLRPDVIIMDINLGRYSGIDVSRRILDWHPEIKIIGLSMHTDENIIHAFLGSGAMTCLSKSGPSEELIAKVRDCFSKTAAE